MSAESRKKHAPTRLTRRELPSTHHCRLLGVCLSSPARVEMTAPFCAASETCRSPGPSLRFTCCAGTDSPGSTKVMAEEKAGREAQATLPPVRRTPACAKRGALDSDVHDGDAAAQGLS